MKASKKQVMKTDHKRTATYARVMDIYYMSLSKSEIIRSQQSIIIGLEKIIYGLQQKINEMEKQPVKK